MVSTADAIAPVLVIDDDDDLREGVVGVIESAGYPAAGARTGREAFALLRGGALRPAVILLDLMMPGMTGWQFRAEQMADPELASIPVIFVSAYPNTLSVIEHGRLRGAAVMGKPVDFDRLLRLLAVHSRRQRRLHSAPSRRRTKASPGDGRSGHR